MSYVEALKSELHEHRAAGRDDRAAECIEELKRLGAAPAAERAVKPRAAAAKA